MGNRKIWITIVVLVLVVFGVKWVTVMKGGSDEKLVQESLARAIAASKDGRPGGVMEYLSESLTVNDQSPARRQVAEFIENSHPDLEVQNPQPVIREDDGTAQINSPVHVKLSLPGGTSIDKVIPDVTLKFQREEAREWLVIPVKRWRLVAVSVPEASIPPELLSGFGGM